MKNHNIQSNYSSWQLFALVAVRALIGWHFLYEGLIKITDPTWSAAPFLRAAHGPFAGFFKSMASNSAILDAVNFCNEWGLVLVGLSLIIGLLSRWACLGGMILLIMYYLSNPPFIGADLSAAEGSYLLVNKDLIELFTLLLLFFFPTGNIIGLDRFFHRQAKN